jgi:3-oxoacyl-[acyl-carrier-protein] synthase-3
MVEHTQRKIGMRGNEVFKLAVNIMGDIVDEVLTISDIQKSEINWLIPHQANIRIIQAIAKKLDLPMSKVIATIDNHGNTSAASIPLALDVSVRQARIKRGDVLLLESFGGGMTWGAMVVRY